ncbi:MAG: transporter substrate-binding domain-containing protein [Schwartzia sp.]|nr:transporter substrate-binding domain-containing protein [Schwartzia sp. (in: firmicutes)]
MKNLQAVWKVWILVFLLMALAVDMVAARAPEKESKVVRVGWYESTFCYRDRFGRRRGIDYEFQQKISAYTGWTFEYVEDSWANLLQKLMAGEIDLLSDVSYTEARTASMLFPDLPMGAESYYIYIDADNKEITSENLASLNGKRIGVNQNSVQEKMLRDWAQSHHIALEVVPLTTKEAESMSLLTKGEIDGYATINTFGAREKIIPVRKIGSSSYFYAVNRNRPDLLDDLNAALSAIHEDDPNFSQRLSDETLSLTKTNAFLTPSQEDWLRKHGPVRVGYRDNYLPFCAKGSKTGDLTGALREYLVHAAASLKNADLRFETVPYPTTEAALEALRSGAVDCVFPVNLNTYDSDEMGFRLTNPAMKTDMQVIMRVSDRHHHLLRKDAITFAVNQGNLNIEAFIKEYYPTSQMVYFPNADESFLEAIASGKADCALVSNYRLRDLDPAMHRHGLFPVPAGEAMSLSFAVNKKDREMYYLLNKVIALTKHKDMDSVLASYSYSSQATSFMQYLRNHWVGVIIVITVVFLVILFLLLQKLKAERKANEQQRLLEEAAKVAELKQSIESLLDNMPGLSFSKDAKTGVYLACNQAYADFAQKPSPESVIGLTDADLFDPATASHFVENDRIALSAVEPQVFFEDVRDAAGNERQFQTTKLKFIDAAGRLCLLGITQDMTDKVRIERENAATRDAYEKLQSTSVIFSYIAKTLARGYSDFYYVNLDTERFIEYRTDEESGEIVETRRRDNFFAELEADTRRYVYPDDRDAVLHALERETLLATLDRDQIFMMSYRLLSDRGPIYVNMRVSRMDDDDRFIIIGVTDVDEQVKQRKAEEQAQEERLAYSRINALAGDYICIYIINPETGRYKEYSATSQFESFAVPKEGVDFFGSARENSKTAVWPEDLDRVLSLLTKEHILAEIERNGLFAMTYRLLMGGKPVYVRFKAAMVEEAEGRRLIVGLNDVDAQVRHEEEYAKRLAHAQKEANLDALTGVKNRHAYLAAEEELDRRIKEQGALDFAIVIFDVNDLKKVNDTQGHHAGDLHIKGACKVICDIFKHSPVFRVGGDEFAVIAQKGDYLIIEELVGKVGDHNREAMQSGGIVIACGMAKHENDDCVAPVFERADHAMYENKSDLKAAQSDRTA